MKSYLLIVLAIKTKKADANLQYTECNMPKLLQESLTANRYMDVNNKNGAGGQTL